MYSRYRHQLIESVYCFIDCYLPYHNVLYHQALLQNYESHTTVTTVAVFSTMLMQSSLLSNANLLVLLSLCGEW